MMRRLFAEHAWLGPGRFARRVLVEFDSHITAVLEFGDGEEPPEDAARVDWLIPGLVNAHCHLEYTWLEDADLPRGTVPFGEWMRAIMSRRPADAHDQERRAEAMRDGVQRLLAGGCTTVFDSTTDGASAAVLAEVGLRHFLFYEVLGLRRERAEPIWNAAMANVTEQARRGPGWQRGTAAESILLGSALNPHAPYSVGGWLRGRLRSDEVGGLAQAWHLAETPDEEALFRAGGGSIADFFRAVGLSMPWNVDDAGTGAASGETVDSAGGGRCHGDARWDSSFDFLRAMGQLERCGLVFHGNELAPDEAEFFRAPRGVVHCPGTHRWFERGAVPLRTWLDAGVNVCLGTDSLASAETLSMLDVVRMTLEDNADLSVDDVLTMACVNPWRVDLGAGAGEGLYGRGIAVGGVADLVALGSEGGAFNERDCGWEELLGVGGSCVVGSWVGGMFVDAAL